MRQGPVPASVVNRGQNLLNGRYTLMEAVGHGAYGIVSKARDSTTGEYVAIKEVKLTGTSQEHLQDVMSEIDLLKSLNHEHIVKYLDSFKTRTHLYIVLEFMEKGDLSNALKPNKFGVFPESLAAMYIAQVLKGLVYLHEQGVVHRDIKGANILTTDQGLVKLGDFGVATNLQETDIGIQDVVGTPYWMAPEVIEMREVTAASDIWSVGCLVMELITGHPPYYELQPMSALFRIVQDSHPVLPEGISQYLEDFLLACFQKEANLRPDARTLLGHPWIRTNKKKNIRATWGRTQGNRVRGGESLYESVSSVVNRILQTDAEGDEEEETELPSPGSNVQGAPPSRFGRVGMVETSPQFHKRAHSTSSMGIESGFGVVTVNPMLPARGMHPTHSMRHPDTFNGSWGASSMDVLVVEETADGEGTTKQAQRDTAVHVTGFSSPQRNLAYSGVMGDVMAGKEWQSPLQAPGGRGGIHDSSAAASPKPDLLGFALAGGMGSSGGDVWGAMGGAPNARTPLSARLAQEGMDRSPSRNPATNLAGAFAMHGGDQDRLAEKRREKDEIKRLISALSMADSTATELSVLGACSRLVASLRESSDRRLFFLENCGPAAVMELLDSDSEKIVEAVLELVNSIVSNDVGALESLCLIGMVPAVIQYADTGRLMPLRLQAAYFMHQVCFAASPQIQQMLIACNGLPVLVRLVEVDFKANRDLAIHGVSCIWHILEIHGPGIRMNDFCRLLAHHGLAERLVSSLSSASQEQRHQESSVNHSRSPSVGSQASQLTPREGPDHSDRIISHSRASSSERPATAANRKRYSLSRGSEVELNRITADHQISQDPSRLLDKIANLLLIFSIADSVVKKHLCTADTLGRLFDTVPHLEPAAALKILRCIKHLTMDENMLSHLQGQEIIRRLVLLLDAQVMGPGAGSPSSSPSHMVGSTHGQSNVRIAASGEEHQLEVVHALYNLCRINKHCQERAAIEGAVRSLNKLVEKNTDGNAKLRTLAISMLCRLAHASSASRAQLWQANGLASFLQLTSEPRWQAPAMDAIATWLAEDLVRIEPKLLAADSLARMTRVFETWKHQLTAGTGVGELKGLLEIFHRILATSRRLNVALSAGTLPGLAVAMLREESPMTSLPLLKILRSLYEAHPHPKEFIIQHGIHKAVQGLAKDEKATLVAKQAQNLLDAFQINSIL